jgi:hypothetical protein
VLSQLEQRGEVSPDELDVVIAVLADEVTCAASGLPRAPRSVPGSAEGDPPNAGAAPALRAAVRPAE